VTARQLTTEQLLHLVDRAARHVILPNEAALLRAEVEGLSAEAWGLRLARVERNAAVLELSVASAAAYPCAECGVGAGVRCVTRSGGRARVPHWVRQRLVEAAVVEAVA
jgi:hypothetical protein